MKKIISGKRYDTEKAILVGVAESSLPTSDFKYWCEKLYKTPVSGAYFLHYTGGPLTGYAVQEGNLTSGSAGIRPISREQAFTWASEYLTGEDVEKEFGDMIQDA